jgi:excinuclease UvrABC nuclease subunit
MTWHIQAAYPLTPPNLYAHAPVKEGVYGIRSGEKWIYFGQSDDLRRRLLEHLRDRSHCMYQYPNLEFVCETTPTSADRLRQLLQEFRPVCNSPFD